jgi:myo-inositol-1(or 4)-monophosphatase
MFAQQNIMNTEKFVQHLHEMQNAAEIETLKYFRTHNGLQNKLNEGWDPVTMGDKAAETAIRNVIEKYYPDHDILGEEFGHKKNGSEFCWVIDPIDGTRGYISGVPTWGTLIGLLYQDQPFLGMMAQPFVGERFWGDNKQSWHQDKFGNIQAMQSRKCDAVENAFMMSSTPDMFITDEEKKIFSHLQKKVTHARFGSDCYAYMMLSLGHIDMVCEASLAIYDIAPLIPIMRGAGGIVTDWSGDHSTLKGQFIAACDEKLHKLVLEEIKKIV